LVAGIPTALTLVICGVLALSFSTVLPELADSLDFGKTPLLHDEDYAVAGRALSERWDSDASIPMAGTYWSFIYVSGEQTQVWLVIEISYTGTCNSTSDDPCEALVDELAGIEVAITNDSNFGPVELSIPPIDKALTIEEWRRELSIDTNILCQTGYRDC
jgi:hypothetical protein